jgi:hypothetical protein
MRSWIAAILFLVFAFQAMPVMAVAKVLAKAHTTLSGSGDAADDEDGGNALPEDGKLKKQADTFGDAFLSVPPSDLTARPLEAVQQHLLQYRQQLPILYAGEVDTPPPDHC